MCRSVPNNFLGDVGLAFLPTKMVGRGDTFFKTKPFTLAINVTDVPFGTTVVLEERRKLSTEFI